MQHIFTDKCPICSAPIRKSYFGIYGCANSYHYEYIGRSNTVWITIPGYTIRYNDDITTIWTTLGIHGKYFCRLPGYFPIDFANLRNTTDRLDKLIAFL